MLGGMLVLDDLLKATPPFLSAVIPTPSEVHDASERLEIRWHNARRLLEQAGASADDLEQLDALRTELPHFNGASVAIAGPTGGPFLTEFLQHPVPRVTVAVDTLPRLGPVLENRQRTIAHLMVVTDRVGADIVAFDGGAPVAEGIVEGETEHIHRGHPGGWSQRRFQQRAENQWERNAKAVADEVATAAREHHAEVVVVAGDVRATGFLTDHLPSDVSALTTVLDVGSPEAIAEATVRVCDDHVARQTLELVGRLGDLVPADKAVRGMDATLNALAASRVSTLLVHDDADDDRRATRTVDGQRLEGRCVDLAIHLALTHGAEVRMIPAVASVSEGFGGILRW